ncbi:MAG: SGNH/GDSL hydrolase family protein [Rikenellaceae bacterium]
MITFIVSILLLIGAYFVYGKFVEKIFGASSSIPTPVKRFADGVDYQELKPWKIFVIQFLNIAGLGPIFGAILGAAYGQMAYIWIVLGCIFMGATHDYFSGMLSVRNDGKSLPDIVSKYLGGGVKKLMVVFTAFLLMAVGVAFVTGPADLIARLSGMNMTMWLYIIFVYYILATLLPIDKIIGKIYPFMGATLIFMAVAVSGAMIYKGFLGEITIPELTFDSFRNMHSNPGVNILFPMMFIVISCGAISGFHATQSPMMARCMTDEKYGRPSFYGAMICEGIVAMIWATAAIAYFGGAEGLNIAADGGKTPAIIVNEICNSWLGRFGAIIAIIGVVVCPITTGDTAFRSLRLIVADAFKFEQKPIKNRLVIAIPIFLVALVFCNLDFSTIWKYVGIGNQVLATIILWTGATYLTTVKKAHWILSIPATFLTMICVSYFVVAPYKAGGLSLDPLVGYIAGIIAAIATFVIFINKKVKKKKSYLLIFLPLLFLLNSNTIHAQRVDKMKFTDAKNLMLLGRGFARTESDYSRLPLNGKDEFRKELWSLAKNSAGLAIRFSSNSTAIAAKWTVMNNFTMNHMPSTGIKGIDLYTIENGVWYYMGTAKPTGKENSAVFIKNMTAKQREYIAYLPLYDGTESVLIGVDSLASIGKPQQNVLLKNEDGGAILFYGTSITQGGCASRPGMAYPAIVGRMLQRETINLGFSGNGRLDRSMARAISQVNAGTVVLDCLPNCTAQIVRDSAYNFIKMILEAKPDVKIYMVENPLFPYLKFDQKTSAEIMEENIEWRSVYQKLRKEKYRNVCFIPGDKLAGADGEATVDGVHMTDLGFMRYAKEFAKYLR